MDDVSFETVKGVSFGVYTTEEIKKFSVLEVTNTEILDLLDHPAPNGLHDLRLGPNEKNDYCETCNLSYFTCPGHIGHISLPVPVYNPAFFQYLYQLLRGSCLHCHKLLAPPNRLYLALYQLQALDYGLVSLVQELAEILTDTTQEIFPDTDYVTHIQTKLKAKFQQAIIGMNKDDKTHCVKSVVECRRKIVKDFIKTSMNVAGKCPHCKMPKKRIVKHNSRIVYVTTKRDMQLQSSLTNGTDEDGLSSTLSSSEILPADARKYLSKLWENDKVFLQNLFKILYLEENQEGLAYNLFFMDMIIVPPTRFRRLNIMKGKKFPDPQTVMLNEILKDCYAMQNLQKFVKQLPLDQVEKDLVNKLTGKTNGEKFSYLYQQLQRHVNEIFDSSVNKDRNKFGKGIKQILEKKEGLFRMNMMGKRVNYSARSVISPDPYINVNEVGVPLVFAKKLTFPEPVSTWNFEKLRHAVMNGPNVHPGAVLVEYEDGRIVRLPEDTARRHAMANTLLTPLSSAAAKVLGGVKIIHRHLKNGDMLLLNRQPTLHKPSIMAHKARILPGEKTLRLHYANCKTYNADFDGDEMNIHLPQSFLGQAECHDVVGVSHQYLVPKDGTPLSGLIQDHIIAGTLLTLRGSFFTKDYYHQLLYSALSFTPKCLKLLPPTIIKPVQLWSGKQIVSSIIINLIPEGKKPPTVEGRTKVSSKNWKNGPVHDYSAGGTLKGDSMSESEVIIRGGELLCGVIDKAQVGPTPYSLIHVCYELYGGEVSSTILTSLARLFTHYLQYYSGFTLGIEDIMVTKRANKERKKTLKKAAVKGRIATAKALEVTYSENLEELVKKYKDAHYSRDDFPLKVLDMEMQNATKELNNDIKNACMPTGLVKKFPVNNLQLMIESGAKGTMVNSMQISCLLGQIELEGRRMPLMLNGSTLPSFSAYDTSPAAGGFVAGRFLTGINPREYFFHCMAGREGLIDTAVKTSRSGYLQRCLIKHLEGITVNYDQTVRDSDGTVIQFLYGEDGLDISKLQMLKEKSLRILAQNYDAAINKDDMKRLMNTVEEDIPQVKRKIKRWKKKHSKHIGRRPLIDCLQEDIGSINIYQRLEMLNMKKSELDEETLRKHERSNRKCPDPLNSQYRPDLVFGSVSEQLDELISDYMDKNLKCSAFTGAPENKMDPVEFQELCHYRSQKALAHPGETVGLLAAQSIGEPSTQMTLNTFHFAGKGEMNVTLGIPRIREILMTASANIATPTMDLPLLDHPDIEEKAEELKLKLNPVSLKEVLENVKVKEYISIHTHSCINYRNYIIRLKFLKHSEYKGFINTTPSKILFYIEHVFVKKLIEAVKKKKRQTCTSKLVDYMKEVTTKFNTTKMKDEELDSGPAERESGVPKDDNDDSSGAEDEGDGDATSAKSRKRHDQEQEYEDPEEDEMPPDSDLDETEKEEGIEIKQEIQTDDEERQKEDVSVPLNFTKRFKGAVSEDDKGSRINAVQCLHSWISKYDFDDEKERWCEISLQIELDQSRIDMKTLLEDEIAKNFVYSVQHINEALLVKNTDPKALCKLMLKTNGVNFLEVFKHVDILDVNKAYSNNIHAIAEIYGIEAAARAIKREIVNVFKPYGIVVDPRHLSLISDYMTSSGYYRPCNRIGIEGNASPLQQMTFETTKTFMVDAMFLGVEDRLKSPSANLIFGQPYEAGTGCFGLKVKPGKHA